EGPHVGSSRRPVGSSRFPSAILIPTARGHLLARPYPTYATRITTMDNPLPQVFPLAGRWLLAVDPDDRGREEGWAAAARPEAVAVPVPGIVQQVFPGAHCPAWYWLRFIPPRTIVPGERAVLRFGAVSYLAQVWLNGVMVGSHQGSEMDFALDATAAMHAGENLLAVRVVKPDGRHRIDGLLLGEIPHRNEYDESEYQPG